MKKSLSILFIILLLALPGGAFLGGWVRSVETVQASTGHPMVAVGYWHTVGLKSDGTLVTVGYNSDGQCDVGDWQEITQVAAGSYHTVGLKSNSTVVAVGWDDYLQCDVDGWEQITQVAAGFGHTVGLRSDGHVVAVGNNGYLQCSVGGWEDITQVAAGWGHTVGLKSDGHVVAVGNNELGQCNVETWTDITRVAAGCYHTVGLKSDGTVVAVGDNGLWQCNVENWADITQIAAGWYHTVGVKSDGNVVAVGYNELGQCNVESWTDITQVAAGPYNTVGLRSNGTVVAVGWDGYSQCDVGDWNLGLTPGPIDTITALNSSVNPSVYSQSVTFTATVSPVAPGAGTPTGDVIFRDGETVLGNATLNSSGQAIYSTSSLSAGSHTVTSDYSGDANFGGSSGDLTQNVWYNFSGFLPPLGKSTCKLGSPIPIKWQLSDASGNFISDLSTVKSLMVGPAGGTLVVPTPNGGTVLHYDTTANQYIFNWQTKGLSAGNYTISLSLVDGTVHTATVTLR